MNCIGDLGFYRIYGVNCFFRALCQEYLQMINVIIVVRDMAGNLVDDTLELLILFGILFRGSFTVKLDNSSFQVPGECGNFRIPVGNHLPDQLNSPKPRVPWGIPYPAGFVIHGNHPWLMLSPVLQPWKERVNPVPHVDFPRAGLFHWEA